MKYAFLSGLIIIAVVILGLFGQAQIETRVLPASPSKSVSAIRLIDDAPEPDRSSSPRTSFQNSRYRSPASSINPTSEPYGIVPNRPARTIVLIATPAKAPTQPNTGANNNNPPTSRLIGSPSTVDATTFFESSHFFVRVPADAAKRQTLRVVVALHGMGGEGEAFASSLVAEADKNGWVLMAPTISYQNYLDMNLLTEDDMRYARELVNTLDALPKRLLGYHLNKRASVYGYSRGAQLAHRFALLYPERVLGVAAMSAGSYTLPYENQTHDGTSHLLPFPFGIGDLYQRVGRAPNYSQLRQVNFFIAVGGRDNRDGDVARAFDPYIGRTRVERASAFQEALKSLGVNTRLVIFPSTGHECTAEMQNAATKFLREADLNAKSEE